MRGPPSRQAIEDAAELASAVAYQRARQKVAFDAARAAGIEPKVDPEWLEWSISCRDIEELLDDEIPVGSDRFRARWRACWLAIERTHIGWCSTREEWLEVEQCLRVALATGWRA